MSKIALSWIYAFVLVFGLPASFARSDEVDYVSVRLESQSASEIVRIVAEVGRPTLLHMKRGDSIAQTIAILCNAIDPTYLNVFLESNPKLSLDDVAELREDQDIEFPACAKFPNVGSQPYSVQSGETMSAIAGKLSIPFDYSVTNSYGHPTDYSTFATAGAIEYANKISGGQLDPAAASVGYFAALNALTTASLNPEQFAGWDFNSIDAQSQITVPELIPDWTAIALKQGIDSDTALDRLAAANVSTPNTSTQMPSSSLRPPAEVTPASIASTCDVSAVTDYLHRMRQDLARVETISNKLRGSEAWRTAVVLIVDTGVPVELLDNASGIFSPRNLAIVRGQEIYASNILPYGRAQTHGVNLALQNVWGSFFRNSPHWDTDYSRASHGLSVAYLVADGIGNSSSQSSGAPPVFGDSSTDYVQLAFANIVDPNTHSIPADGLSRALTFAAKNNISILNVSLETAMRDGSWESETKSADGKMLMVVAAGNSTALIGKTMVWPAMFGGSVGNVDDLPTLTVGAATHNGKIATFSNYGSSYVDLLAPGCNILTYRSSDGSGAMKSHESGTSFAAPLVSHFAARLWAEGLSPVEIRSRLLLGVDTFGALQDSAYASGVLDPAKALSLWADVVEVCDSGNAESCRLSGQSLKFGYLELNQGGLFSCGDKKIGSNIRKFSVVELEDESTRQVVHQLFYWKGNETNSADRKITRETCMSYQILADTVKFYNYETEEYEIIETNMIVDYVAAEFPMPLLQPK